MESHKPISLLETYLKRKGFNVDINTRRFGAYRTGLNDLQELSNFAVFPKKKYIEKSDDGITNTIYVCDLLVADVNYTEEILEDEITINQIQHLKTFDALKQFLVLQEPAIMIKPDLTKSQKDKYLDTFRHILTFGYECVFGLNTGYKVERIGFSDDGLKFMFNNGILHLTDGRFEDGEYKLNNDASISLSYCPEEVNKLTLEESLSDCISMEKYVSSERTIAAITIGYLICGIFRKEYKEIHNEFPFLGFEGYSGIGKTSLLNFLSWVVGYDRDSINGVCDTDYAFEVGMNSLGSWYYFVDELQKISAKLQKTIQAAFNSGKNHKGGKDGKRQEIQTYRKDCCLIGAGEVMPQQEEALLNRFIICCPSKPFSVKRLLDDTDEFIKYMELSQKEPASLEYLSTDEIKYLAVNYYKPRFMCILKGKHHIDFLKYHNDATEYINKFTDDSVDVRHKNNLICVITGYLILHQDNVNEEELKVIIQDYFSKLKVYRERTILSGVIAEYIIDNISEFGSWMGRVKGTSQFGPMIRIKSSKNEEGLIMQIDNIVRYCKDKTESHLQPKHIKQQFLQAIGISEEFKSGNIKFAKGTRNIAGTLIPLSVVKSNEYLSKIRDVVLSYQNGHVEELRHILEGEDRHDRYSMGEKQSIQKIMPSDILSKLCEELEETSSNAKFFDDSYRAENEEVKPF